MFIIVAFALKDPQCYFNPKNIDTAHNPFSAIFPLVKKPQIIEICDTYLLIYLIPGAIDERDANGDIYYTDGLKRLLTMPTGMMMSGRYWEFRFANDKSKFVKRTGVFLNETSTDRYERFVENFDIFSRHLIINDKFGSTSVVASNGKKTKLSLVTPGTLQPMMQFIGDKCVGANFEMTLDAECKTHTMYDILDYYREKSADGMKINLFYHLAVKLDYPAWIDIYNEDGDEFIRYDYILKCSHRKSSRQENID